jgi:hypothetical protein
MAMYVIAVKREKRREMSLPDAVAPLKGLEGVRILDDPTERSWIRASITSEALSRVEQLISPYCHIEAEIEHRFAI